MLFRSKVSHNDAAKALICAATGPTTATAFTSTVANGCNPDFSMWNVGSRAQWDVTKGLYLGVDVLYTRLNTAVVNSAGTLTYAVSDQKQSGKLAGVYSTGDQSAWTAAFRIHRDIVP